MRPPIVFYAFDLLRLNGKDLQNLPIEERKAKLEGLLKKPPGVVRYSVSFTNKIEELLSRAQELGLEGMVGKRSGSRYEAGKRTGAWVKIKLYQEQEFVVGGYTEPEGSRKYFGALLVALTKAKASNSPAESEPASAKSFCARCLMICRKFGLKLARFLISRPPGLNQWDQGLAAAEMKRCHWVTPIMVCQVKFTEWTHDDQLCQPVFLGLRTDKRAKEVVRE